MATFGRKAVTRRGMLRASAIGSYPDSPFCPLVDPKAACPLPAQFRPLTESAPERVSCPVHAGEAGSDRVRAVRRRKGPHSTASVLRRDVRVLDFVRHSRTQIGLAENATHRPPVIAM